jgi:hypothetical protein
VYGMVRYKKMLKVLLTALYFKHGSEVSRDDYGMYVIQPFHQCVFVTLCLGT